MTAASKLKNVLSAANLRERKVVLQMGDMKAGHSSLLHLEPSVAFETLFAIDYDTTVLKTVVSALPPLRRDGPWLAGGALRRTLLGEQPDGDFDIFFQDAKQHKSFCAALKRSGFTETGKTKNYRLFEKEIAGAPREIQCVHNCFFDRIEDLIASFDFTNCMIGYDGEHITVSEMAIDAIETRELKINVVVNPLKSLTRVLKYAEQGFMPTMECLVALRRKMKENYEEDLKDLQY